MLKTAGGTALSPGGAAAQRICMITVTVKPNPEMSLRQFAFSNIRVASRSRLIIVTRERPIGESQAFDLARFVGAHSDRG